MSKKLKNINFSDNYMILGWDSGDVNYVSLKKLRLQCPCAFCSGETDVLGNIYKGPKKSLKESAFELKQYSFVGQYGLRIVWGDGHKDGIYTFSFLKKSIGLDD